MSTYKRKRIFNLDKHNELREVVLDQWVEWSLLTQTSAVRIQSSANSIYYQLYYKLLRKDKKDWNAHYLKKLNKRMHYYH